MAGSIPVDSRQVANMRFPFGPAPALMLALSLASGIWLGAQNRTVKKADLVFWTFSTTHYDAYLKALPKFQKAHPDKVIDVQLVSGTGLPQRLQAAFQAGLTGDVPDVCEIEISNAGTFFRGPVEHVGFWDITDTLKAEGLDKRIIGARFTPYTYKGRIFGLPHDVHPVMLAYNREAFTELGLKPENLTTWDSFIAAGKKVRKPGDRYITEFSDSGVDQLMTILLQKGGGLFDANGNVTFDDEIGLETLLWYIPLVADKQESQIASSLSSSFGQVMTQALEDEYFLTVVTPDWRSKQHETNVGKLSGKMGLMPLPTFSGNPRKTSTWGGTMLGITRKCVDKQLAWDFAKFLYLNKEDLAERYSETYILPPVPDAWNEPAFDQAYAFYGGQRIGRDYATLALDVPSQYTSPFQDVAKGKFGQVLIAGVAHYSKNGPDGLRDFVARALKSRADEVRKRIARNPF